MEANAGLPPRTAHSRRARPADRRTGVTLATMAETVVVNLTSEERTFLRHGLAEWWGPARCTDAFAVAMGFESREHLHDDIARLRDTLEVNGPLPPEDWRRLMLAVEVVFASDVVGSGLDWATTTGIPDTESIGLLRAIQRKMPRWRSSFQFTLSAEGKALISDAERPQAEDG